jgi:photosystem II stability/assembly factor-like uncharacterized protein
MYAMNRNGGLAAALCLAGVLGMGCSGLAGGEGGWTAMPLLDDDSVPDDPGWHQGRSLVTGVRFASLDDGVVVVAADNGGRVGGAIFGARADAITDIRLTGRDSVCSTGAVDFHGLVETPGGYVALTDSCALVASDDGGASFTASRMYGDGGDQFALEKALALVVNGEGSVIVRDTGVVSRTDGAPGEAAIWEDVWAPDAIPSIPAEVPEDQCQDGPVSEQVPVVPQAAYVAPDGDFIAYSAAPEGQPPQICLSRDGGRSFVPSTIEAISQVRPVGVHFVDDQVGLTWYSNIFAAEDTYVQRTGDGGRTWSEVALPPELDGVRVSLRAMFFAPGGTVGWLAGYDLDARRPLLLKTVDAGQSFALLDGGLAEALPDVSLHAGFALDEEHLWVGGSQGGLAYSSTGGE